MHLGRLVPVLLTVLVAGQVALADLIPYPTRDGTPAGTPYRISSAFGPRMLSKTNFDPFHEGIDFQGPPYGNDPVYALDSGILTRIGLDARPKGFMVVLQVEGQRKFRYLHLFPNDEVVAFQKKE